MINKRYCFKYFFMIVSSISFQNFIHGTKHKKKIEVHNTNSKRKVFFKKVTHKKDNIKKNIYNIVHQTNKIFKKFGITLQEKEKLLRLAANRCPDLNFQNIDHLYKLTLSAVSHDEFVFHGFHHDHLAKVKESGILTYSNIIFYDLDFYKATINYNGVSKFYTFFPDIWSRKKVFKTILDSINNSESIIEKENKVNITGYSEVDGYSIKIKSCFDLNNNFITAYPSL